MAKLAGCSLAATIGSKDVAELDLCLDRNQEYAANAEAGRRQGYYDEDDEPERRFRCTADAFFEVLDQILRIAPRTHYSMAFEAASSRFMQDRVH